MSLKHNKALKRDSCRVAFLVCGDFCGENGLRKAGLCGTHPLTRRYVLGRSNEYRRNGNFRFRLSR
ncbi:TPA: DUF3265 domain-containing protein [Vibrio parahaemolyticus]|nr:DUF3265 domain-containing protein [Vibrio parahaemolyticus]EHU4841373.1 DUF3265 domain-containing protein [Vibrio parahaemolyticus]EHU5162164.1 DUF3265 domain-containing protein [Vibrio parahaemolyticus]EJG0650193.1 DUF3265 domain-containing protein [Vibrio parahaemolyticus]ELA9417243.1 DUF3265 domain-containing protein [Vibrio parahaemolyticus]MCI9706854.1 DUF3265 domain-containing protein [Vibrio parahaemolyticus]